MSILLEQEKPSLEELSHHGVKGMHWGVRRNRDDSDGSSSTKSTVKQKSTTPEHKKLSSTQKKVLIGASAAAGAVAAGYLLHHYGGVKVSELPSIHRPELPRPKAAPSSPHLASRAREAREAFVDKGLSKPERLTANADWQERAKKMQSFYASELAKNQAAAVQDQNMALALLRNMPKS